jgi:hypothetical protein
VLAVSRTHIRVAIDSKFVVGVELSELEDRVDTLIPVPTAADVEKVAPLVRIAQLVLGFSQPVPSLANNHHNYQPQLCLLGKRVCVAQGAND